MSSSIIDLNSYRRVKNRSRVFEALEALHMEMMCRLENEDGQIPPEEFEEFMVQVLADHLVGKLSSIKDIQLLDDSYRRFDERLRKCLQTKLKSLRHFENMQQR